MKHFKDCKESKDCKVAKHLQALLARKELPLTFNYQGGQSPTRCNILTKAAEYK